MKILAFGATTNRQSINKQLAEYAAKLVIGADVEVLDLNSFELPIFSQDKEAEIGQPEAAVRFIDKIANADALVISFAEHNGSYTAAYKNIFDWASRVKQKVFQNTPLIMLSTSPGAGGGASVLSSAVNSAPHFEADLKGFLSIPKFYENFDVDTQQLINEELVIELKDLMSRL